jgi:predicted ribosome quality control (RQC) complex YloA/Tae2 family protein
LPHVVANRERISLVQHVDALTLAAVADDLRATLGGARVDDVIQPTPDAVALQCYGGGTTRWLLASAHPEHGRIHLIDRKPRKLVIEPPAFVMLLRKHLEGARLTEVRQPPWERLVELGFQRTSEPAMAWLVVEVMGRLSNLILRDDGGTILGALHQVRAEVNRYRTIAPHVAYRYPPAQTRTLHGEVLPRLTGETLTAEDLRTAAEAMLAAPSAAPSASLPSRPLSLRHMAAGDPPARARRKEQAPSLRGLLTAHLAGFSRELASEVIFRTLGAPDAPLDLSTPWGALAAHTRELAASMQTRNWRPTLVYADGDAPDEGALPSAFAVHEPRQYMGAVLRKAPTADAMIAAYFCDVEWRGAVDHAKGDLRRLMQTNHDRCVRKGQALQTELRALDEADGLRQEADTLLAFQTEVPAGATNFTIENPFAASGQPEMLDIALEPRLSAVENATKKYERYHKLQRARAQIPPQIAANRLEMARIEQLQTDLALAEIPDEIAQVRAEVAEAGYLRGRRPDPHGKKRGDGKPAKGGKAGQVMRQGQRAASGGAPLRRQSSDGFTVLVGKNSRQNEEVTFHEARANDIWLHARGVPGAHVIIRSGGRPVPEATLREAAALAAYYSQFRSSGNVPVDHTEQRYVRHMKGGGPGMVIYERERTIYVTPADSDER